MDFTIPDTPLRLPPWDKHFDRTCANYQLPVVLMALAHATPKRRALAVDGGAHVGYWSRILALVFARVLAFEPNVLLATCFSANVPRAELRMEALGARAGLCRIRIANASNSGSGETELERGKIPVRALDSLDLPALDFLKLDLQGSELAALEGARATLLRHKPTLCIEGPPDGAAERYVRDELGASVCARLGDDFVAGWGYAHTHGAFRSMPA